MIGKKNVFLILVVVVLVSVNSIDSLKTGYKIIVPDVLTQLKLLKCSYLFNAKFNMEIHKMNLENQEMSTVVAIEEIYNYITTIKKMMCTLFFVEGIELGSLWLLNLYVSDLGIFQYKHKKLIRGNDLFNNVLKTLNFVIEKINDDVKDCPEGSQFFISNSVITECRNSDMSKIISIQNQKFEELDNLMSENLNRNKTLTTDEKIFIFTKTVLFLKYFKDPAKNHRMLKGYNVQVSWCQAGNSIDRLYHSTKFFDWGFNHFQHHKRYFKAVFSFLKMIMLRLTWKHLLYLKYQSIDSIVYSIEKWIIILCNFSYTLHLEKDVMIEKVKKCLNDYKDFYIATTELNDEQTTVMFNHESIDNLINTLIPFLEILCEDLGCNAVLPMDLNGNESDPFNAHKFRSKPVHNVRSFSTINHYSIMYAEDFIHSIKCFLSRERLETVFAFIDYIDEITKFNPFDDIDLGIRKS